MPNRNDVIASARRLIDVPFRHQGRGPEGLDCVGLIIAVAHDLRVGLDWPEMPYALFPPADTVRGALDRYLDGPLPGPPRPGDIALVRRRRTANHLAIVADGDKPYSLIHADWSQERVVEHRADWHWQLRVAALYRFEGVE